MGRKGPLWRKGGPRDSKLQTSTEAVLGGAQMPREMPDS
jgi:hypothetical protein